MKLGRLYEEVVRLGIENDPRTGSEIREELKKRKKAYNKLSPVEKKYFDKETLKQPYSDTRILYGAPEKEIKTILVGVDMEAQELVLADRLKEKGLEIDLVMAHHPEGKALSNLSEVMNIHKKMLHRYGIKPTIADPMTDDRINEVARNLSAANHSRSVDAAVLLDMPFICVHTPADNHVSTYLQGIFDKKKPKKVKDVMAILRSIPEYRIGMEREHGPVLITGKMENETGKIFVDMTGGTEGPKKVFARLSQAGVGTIIGMHFSETHYSNAKDEHINLIIAGHISSDILGLNLLFDNLEKKESLNLIGCSGFERIKRNT